MHAYYLLFCMCVKLRNEGNYDDILDSFNNKKALNSFRACGDEWTRTTDSRIFSPMLYQLSYITVC